MENAKKINIHHLTLIGVMAAVICILGPLSLPIGIVPISLTNLAIYFSVYVLGQKRGTLSYIVYLFIGLVGLPVFSGFSGGFTKLFGPTGGYLIGFIFMAFISGIFIDKFSNKIYMCFLGMILGTIVTYIFGTAWLAYQLNMTFNASLAIGVIPFILGDIVKMVIASLIGPQIKKRLISAGLIE
ncbi:biotin transporter BioY [Clostridium estertheticum]|uniref:Biotin transporter n=1 Tax=Clostridium estertheticum subsp. estertheticum TaxID=1552 RepID=A0A1J0GDE4_9CLOT|nr:biotin transporter BioY [Clostridium estertheticum]APC38918.1 biotin biosynthesis protein BioY [Clostridium estertheticum subsp. estertheticum]MBZ9615133.1 biotin transporter BioY [Clostridium estertheticum subsp. laramiense]WAG75031.1 biotin transporter BioY [Clostridium estertheticum]